MTDFTRALDILNTSLSSPATAITSVARKLGVFGTAFGNVSKVTNSINNVLASYGNSDSFGRPVLSRALARQDPLMSYCWYADFPNINGRNMGWEYVEEFTAPMRSFNPLSFYKEGQEYHYAGTMGLSSLSAAFYDDSSGLTGSYLDSWRNLISGPNGRRNYPQVYKKDVKLTILNVTREIKVYQIIYKGCWPTSGDPMSLQSASSERIIQRQEFSVDEIEIIINNIPSVGLASILTGGLNNFPGSLNQYLGNAGNALKTNVEGIYNNKIDTIKRLF